MCHPVLRLTQASGSPCNLPIRFSARRGHPVFRIKDSDDGDETRDQTQEGGDGVGHGEEAEGVRRDGGVAGVDQLGCNSIHI